MKPKFILSKSKVLSQYKLVEPIADIISYSSKTNPIMSDILEKETTCMFSVHLKNELKNTKDFSRIIFLAQGWKEENVKNLISKGVNWFVVDNEPDLDTLIFFLEKNPSKINLLLRVKLQEHSVKTERYFVFGMKTEVVSKRLLELKNNDNFESLGIHFHRKTQNMSEWNYQYELENMFEKEVFEMINYINIGGGLPSNYANTNIEVVNGIMKKVSELKIWLNSLNINMIIEPGRFISAPACKLETEIIGVYENNIIVNASVYNSDMDALIVPVKLLVENEISKEECDPFVIKGITPCSLDLFRYKVYLKNPKVGDKIIFLNAGAYNFTTDFCDLEKVETEIVE